MMRKTISLTLLTLALGAISCAQSAPTRKAPEPSKVDYPLTATPIASTVYPSFRLITVIDVNFDSSPRDSNGITLQTHIMHALAAGWDCHKVANYDVEYKVRGGTPHKVPVLMATVNSTCKATESLPNVRLYLAETPRLDAKYTVAISADSKTARSGEVAFTAPELSSASVPSGPSAISAGFQTILNEPLTDKTYKGVSQATLAYGNPSLKSGNWGAIYLDSNNLFSTNERDKKSAFEAAVGYHRGLLPNWYSPFKIEPSIQGNQVATNLSMVTSVGLSTELPWHWTNAFLNNAFIRVPLSPELSLNAPYTHRINQLVSANSKLLADNDFALTPSLAFAHNSLLDGLCKKYQGWLLGSGSPKPPTSKFCLGLEADLGLWYLPLDLTKSGSQRVEGYGDVSFLIPITDFQWPFTPASLSSQALQSQIRIEYADSVSAINNYARTKKWSFGVELIK
jgi:hypothetical protein